MVPYFKKNMLGSLEMFSRRWLGYLSRWNEIIMSICLIMYLFLGCLETKNWCSIFHRSGVHVNVGSGKSSHLYYRCSGKHGNKNLAKIKVFRNNKVSRKLCFPWKKQIISSAIPWNITYFQHHYEQNEHDFNIKKNI